MLKTGECLNRCNYPWMSLIAKLTIKKKKKKNSSSVLFFCGIYVYCCSGAMLCILLMNVYVRNTSDLVASTCNWIRHAGTVRKAFFSDHYCVVK